jgi:CRP-like cAMP-binding protein
MSLPEIRNRLLKALSPDDLALLTPNLVFDTFPQRHHFEVAGRPFNHICFPQTLVTSIVAKQGDLLVEVGLIGCEGMTGSAVLLAADRSINASFVQIAGDGFVIPVNDVLTAIQKSESLRLTFLKYVQVLVHQTSHTAVANSVAKLPQRLARWLLMAHDRVPGNTLKLTHEFLAVMLAVRRAGVTETVKKLEEDGLITCSRGVVQVLNRKGLEKIAGQFYGKPEAEYRRLLSRVSVTERTP